MAPEPSDPKPTPGSLQYLLHRADPHHQRLPQAGQPHPQLFQTLGAEGPLPRRGISLLPELGLHHHKGQHWPAKAGLQKGLVVDQAQIPLEPDDLHRLHGSTAAGSGEGETGGVEMLEIKQHHQKPAYQHQRTDPGKSDQDLAHGGTHEVIVISHNN